MIQLPLQILRTYSGGFSNFHHLQSIAASCPTHIAVSGGWGLKQMVSRRSNKYIFYIAAILMAPPQLQVTNFTQADHHLLRCGGAEGREQPGHN